MNVKEFREKSGLSQQELADRTGIPKDRIAKWEQGKGNPKGDDTFTLTKFFEEFIPQDHSPNTFKQEQTPYLNKRRNKKNHDFSPFMVPLVPVSAQAGYGKSFRNTDFINKLNDYPIVPGVDHHGAIWRYFQVDGDSMFDTFNDGDYVLTSQVPKEDWADLKDWLVYVVVTDEKLLIKRVTKIKGAEIWVLTSDNEKYKQTKINISEVNELWKYRRHIGWNASPPKKFEIKI